MKIKHIFLLVSGIVVLFSSCSKALDTAPAGRISMDEVFADNDRTAAFLNTCYNGIQVKGIQYNFWTNWYIATTDEAYDSDCEELPSYPVNTTLIGNVTAASSPFDVWSHYWGFIRRCTLFIGRIDSANVSSEENRKRWKAEAHLLRAYYYTELMKLYGGGLPIEREVFHYDTTDFTTVERASFYELTKFVMEDCDFALNTDELPTRITLSAQALRVTKALAWTLKSKIMLYAASPLWNEEENRWQEAYQVTKAAYEQLRDWGYELYAKNRVAVYTGNDAHLTPEGYPADKALAAAYINEYFTQAMQYDDTDGDRETIWQDTRIHGTPWNVQGIGAQGGYKCGWCPTQEMVDAYETINGKSVLNRDNPYKNEKHTEVNVNTDNEQYDETDPYQNRDPRFYAHIYYNGAQRYTYWAFKREGSPDVRLELIDMTNNDNSNRIGADIYKLLPTFRERSRTGYYARKYLHPTTGNTMNVNMPPWKHFRFAEVILNYAEAAAEAGHTTDALMAVNLIRNRAKMPEITETNQAELIKRIRAERRVELAFEEHRYFDIRRWTAPGGTLASVNRYTTAMEVTRSGAGAFATYTYKRVPTIKCLSGEYKNWESKFLLLPVPLGEVNRMRALTGDDWQNTGW